MTNWDEINKRHVNLINRRVLIKNSDKAHYIAQGIIGKNGTVKRVNGNHIGVLIDGHTNSGSSYGIFWFETVELKLLKEESEIIMENYKYVAIVNLVEDINKRDYGFAIYDEERDIYNRFNMDMVVVLTKGKHKLAYVKDVQSLDEYIYNTGSAPTAEVVGIVDMRNYEAREYEKKRLAEIAEKKAAIELELEKEINKRKSIEYYEEMASKYSDNPKLAELVEQLKKVGEL